MTVPIPIRSQGSRRGGLESVAEGIGVPISDWRRGVEITPVCAATPFAWNCSSSQRVAPGDPIVPPTPPPGQEPVNLYTTDTYGILAGTSVTNTGPTTINGDLGISPGSTLTGYPPGVVTGATHLGDGAALIAQNDLITVYNDLAGRTPFNVVSGDLGGLTLGAGVYQSASSLGLTGVLTLDGGGDPNAVFIFQMGSTLTTASGSSVVLTGGAQACNVFWQMGSSATIGTGSAFIGTLVALTSITVTTGATIDGRALARNGTVTTDTNVITPPTCAPPALGPDVIVYDVRKPLTDMSAGALFYPTHIGVETECGPNSANTPIGDTQRRTAEVALERGRWGRAARLLHDGDDGSLLDADFNPSFQSVGVVPTLQNFVTPAGLPASLQFLLEFACECWGDTTVLHVPQEYMPHFLKNNLVEWDGTRYHIGWIPVSFDCYPNFGPVSVVNQADRAVNSDGSEVWIYATGTPLVSWGDAEFIDAFDAQQNERVVELVRPVIAAFDTCCVVAAKAKVCFETCT